MRDVGAGKPFHSSLTAHARWEPSKLPESCTCWLSHPEVSMNSKAVHYVSKSASAAAGSIGTAAVAAASAVAAAAVAASIVLSPVPDATARMDGVRADLQKAVELNQITAEQAARFEAKLAGRILGEA